MEPGFIVSITTNQFLSGISDIFLEVDTKILASLAQGKEQASFLNPFLTAEGLRIFSMHCKWTKCNLHLSYFAFLLILSAVLLAQCLAAEAVLAVTLVERFQIFTLTAQFIILLLIAFLTIVQAFYRSLQGGNGQAEALDSRAEIIDGVYEILAFHIRQHKLHSSPNGDIQPDYGIFLFVSRGTGQY